MDNASTNCPKPRGVMEAMARFAWECSVSPGRRSHAMDRRLRKVVANGGIPEEPDLNGTTDYLYGGQQCVEERSGTSQLLCQYVWGRYIDELIQQKEVE